MNTIVIGTGLTNEYLGSRHQYLSSRLSVGEREIERILGRGKNAGEGPIPSFLNAAADSESTGLVFIGSSDENDSDALVGALEDSAKEAVILPSDGEIVPWRPLLETISRLTGDDQIGPDSETRFLVVGTHTETQILAITSFLRRTLGFSNVAVCTHLVASSTLEAHLSTLRYTLPTLGVDVFLDLEEAASWAGLKPEQFSSFDARPCVIEPPDVVESITDEQKAIIELLCLHWTKTRISPISGGFSGSLLLLASGWKGEAHTEPMVLKIDSFDQMRRELAGYYQVKDFFGKHVPTFGYPVARGELLGVGMELAAMEGTPETLQDNFEEAEAEADVSRFMRRFEKALDLLSEKLYRNTRELASVVPYRIFGLHVERQLDWLIKNAEIILGYLKEAGGDDSHIDPDYVAMMLKLVARNEDGIESEVCLEHGDLNFANVICDEGENIWFIDWTHSNPHPLELDFAKLENDAKFVMSKNFEVDDLPRLRKFEEFLLSHKIPPDVDGLPDSLKFAKWDLRFRKVLSTVRKVRETCFALKESDDWLVYRVALLRYATHTLSFDKQRNRGECELPQLMYALYSVEHLTFNLVADDYHLKIRAERPTSYPARQRLLMDSAIWALDCDEYDPPYHVDPMVLDNDMTKNPDGWADPEDVTKIEDELASRPAKRRDELGRPLNPRGRTGIAGRGVLGMWGRNLSVATSIIRSGRSGELEILLGKTFEGEFAIPRSFIRPTESVEKCLQRTLDAETGWQGDLEKSEKFFDAYTYDARQTDHAWVETQGFVLFDEEGSFPETYSPRENFDEVKWWPLNAETVNRVSAGSARFVREAVKHLGDGQRIDQSVADALLAATG